MFTIPLTEYLAMVHQFDVATEHHSEYGDDLELVDLYELFEVATMVEAFATVYQLNRLCRHPKRHFIT